ncbi:hypothetical protein HAX54_005788, partial [Datura stramonium]|nr:hypothetical protein [Datura stramonium]
FNVTTLIHGIYSNFFGLSVRVVVDNESCKNATVNRTNEHGILLEVVQVLTDLNFIITKTYICFDGGWFTDKDIYLYVLFDLSSFSVDFCHSLGPNSCFASSMRRSVGVTTGMNDASIELIGSDRRGLLSEVSVVLTNHRSPDHNSSFTATVKATAPYFFGVGIWWNLANSLFKFLNL